MCDYNIVILAALGDAQFVFKLDSNYVLIKMDDFLYCVFILSTIFPYTTGVKALFNPSDCTGTAPTHK